MGKIERFEDLKCWQAARKLVKEVFISSEQGKIAKDFDLKSQFRKAALSSMNNIAEGFGRYSSKDFIRFLDISQSSVQEIQSMLYVISDLDYLAEEKINVIRSLTAEIKNLTLALVKYLKTKQK